MIKWENDSRDKKQHRRRGTKNCEMRKVSLSIEIVHENTERNDDDEVEESSDILNR